MGRWRVNEGSASGMMDIKRQISAALWTLQGCRPERARRQDRWRPAAMRSGSCGHSARHGRGRLFAGVADGRTRINDARPR